MLTTYDKTASIPFLANGVLEVHVDSVAANGWVYVTVPRQTGDLVRGPFPILASPLTPKPGDLGLAAFIEGRPDEIVILGLFGKVTSVTMGTCVVYNVLDYGVVANAASAASANVTALASVETAVQSAGCGIIYFPCGTYYLDGAASAIFLTVDTDNVTLAAEAGVGATIQDQRTGAGTIVKFAGASGNYITNCAVRDLKFTGANAGANARKAIELQYVEGLRVDRCEFTNNAQSIWADDVRDCIVSFCVFDGCSVTDASNKAAVYLSSNSGASKVSRSVRFHDCLWRNNYQYDVFLEGSTTAVSHVRFDACRFQNDGFIRGDRIRLSLVDDVTIDSCEFSLGDFHTGYTTKINAISVEGTSTAVSLMNNHFEAQGVASGSATISSFVYAGTGSDSCTGLTAIGNNFVVGTNHALAQACIRYGTAVSKVFRAGNRVITDTPGNTSLETGSPTTLSSLGVATLGHLIAPTRSITSGTTVTQNDDVILANANSASLIVTLPAIASSPYRIAVKKTDSSANKVRITPTGGNIEGAANLDLQNLNECATLVHDGTNWWVT